MRSHFGGSFTGNFGKGLQCVWVGLLKSGVGYREERADRRLGFVSFVNLVHLDDMRSREITGDRIWCAEVDFWRVKILVGWGLVRDTEMCGAQERTLRSGQCFAGEQSGPQCTFGADKTGMLAHFLGRYGRK